MAGVKWRELLDPITGKPFKNYYQYRNWLAKVQGYKSYAEKRKLRKQGIYTIPAKARERRPGPKADLPASPAVEIPSSTTTPARLPRTQLGAQSAKINEAIKDWAAGGWVSNVTPASRAISRDEYEEMIRQVEETFGDGLGDNDYIKQVWRMAYQDVGVDKRLITSTDGEIMTRETERLKGRLLSGIDTMRQNAAAWDRGAKRVQTQEQAKKFLKNNPVVAAEKYSNGTRIDMRFLEEQVYADIQGRIFQTARLTALSKKGDEVLILVEDGPDCGWESHDDGLKAHGLILPLVEAMKRPSAHPHCRRRFTVYQPFGEGGKRDQKAANEMAKQIQEKRKQKIAARAEKAAGTAAVVTAVLGLATAEVKLQLGQAILQGTVGDLLVNSIGPLVRRAAQNLISLQQRIVSVLQMDPNNREIAARVTEIARKMREELPELTGYTQDQAEALLMEAVHAESLAWQQTADTNVISLASRRVLNMPEVITEKVVGDSFGDFENLYRIKYYNKIPDGEDAVTFMSNMMESQNIFTQAFFDSIQPISGRYGRFTLPKINVIEGNVEAGKRATHRYARFALNPNDMIHTHLSVKPLRDGTLRTIKNVKINPNGLVRFGFVKDEKGVITPNLSLVPRGPLRLYSRINRSAATIVERDTGRLIPNPAKGRFNSLTTDIVLKTPWSRWMDSVGFKFRLNLASLGIHKPSDILDIRWPEFRAFLQTNNPKHFKMISAAADLNVRGFNMFQFQHTLRIDENGMWAWRAGINEIEKSIMYLLNLYKNELMTARIEDRSYIEALFQAHAESIAYFRGMGLDYRQRIEAAKIQLGGRWRDLSEAPPEQLMSWKTAQWIFHMAQKEVEQRVDDLTDILISYRRKSIKDVVVEPPGIKLADAQRVYVLSESKADQRWALQNANLVTAFLEADYVQMAKDIGVEVFDIEKRAQEIVGIVERLLTRHINAVPVKFRDATLARLEKLQMKMGTAVEDTAAPESSLEGVSWGNWFWVRKFKSLTPEEAKILLTPGSKFSAEDIGSPLAFRKVASERDASLTMIDAMRADPDTAKWLPTAGRDETMVRFVVEGPIAVRDGRLVGRYEVVGVEDVAATGDRLYNNDLIHIIRNKSKNSDLYGSLSRVVSEDELPWWSADAPIRMVYLRRVGLTDTTSERHLLSALTQVLNEAGEMTAGATERARSVIDTFPHISGAAQRFLSEWRLARSTDAVEAGPVAAEAGKKALTAPAVAQAKTPTSERATEVLLDLLGHAPVTTTRLYRAVDVTDHQLESLTVGERFIDMMGLWTADSGAITRGTSAEQKSQVIFVAKRAKFVNLGPFATRPTPFSFLVSGEFKITNVLTQIREDGEVITWVELDYIRKAVL